MRTIANKLKEQGVQVINFAASELDIDTFDWVKEGAFNATKAGKNAFTPAMRLPTLREQESTLVTQHTRINFTLQKVDVTSGTKQALLNVMMFMLDPHDEMIIPPPYRATFPTQVELAGGCAVFIHTCSHGYKLVARAVERAITPKTKAIITLPVRRKYHW